MAEYDNGENNEEEFTVIIDIGEANTKVGFAGEENPRIFPTITGKEKYKNVMVDVSQHTKKSYVGNDCMSMRGVLKITHPISRGNIMDWEAYFSVLTHIFYNVLRIDPSKANVIYSEPPLSPDQTKQYIARVLFETYKVKKAYVASSPVLAMFSVGATTGVVVESGEGLTWVVPVINGKVITHAIQKLPLAGIDVNENLKSLLLRYGISLSYSAQREILREIKEKNCFIALDPEKAAKNASEVNTYVLPDGETVNIPMEARVNAPEILFHPEILGYNTLSIAQAIITAISKTDRNSWRKLLQNIILSGGNTMFQGIELRLEQDLKFLLPQLGPIPEPAQKQNVAPPPKPKLVNMASPSKLKDTCPKCSTMVDLQESKFCPNCGFNFEESEIKIPGSAIAKYPEKCPNCNKKLEIQSEFCPYCGKKLEKVVVQEKESKLESSEVSPPKDEFEGFEASEFKDDDIETNKPSEETTKEIRIVLPDNRHLAIFNGGAILGSLDSFKKLFITYQEYLQNPAAVHSDFSQIL